MNKRYVVLLSVCLIVIVLGSLIWYVETPKWGTADSHSILWQTDLEHFETGFTAADGKVFVTDAWANLYCYDANSGKSLWNATTSDGGGYAGGQVIVYNGKVYVAALGLVIDRFDEVTGKLEMQYAVPNDYSTPYKMIPSFFIADEKMFGFDGANLAVYDLASGQELWSNYFRTGHVIYDAGNSMPKSNFTYVVYDSNTLTTNGLDPNTGNVLWQYLGQVIGSPVISQQQVILWNYIPRETDDSQQRAIVCLNAQTGQEQWRFNTGTEVFAPTLFNGLLLFAAEDRNYYALSITDGSLKWKTDVGRSLGTPPFIDENNQRIFWSILTSSNNQASYSGAILSLDLQNGNKILSPSTDLTSVSAIFGQDNTVLLNNRLFAHMGNGILCLDLSSGIVLWERSFDHYVRSPILLDNKAFVAADLYLIAYK